MTDSLDARLAEAIKQLERTRWASFVVDADFRLVWLSDAMKVFLREDDERKLGYGENFVKVLQGETWRAVADEGDWLRALAEGAPYLMAEFPGGKDGMKALLDEPLQSALDSVEPQPPPLMWANDFHYVEAKGPGWKVDYLLTPLRDQTGKLLGAYMVSFIGVRPTLTALLARGDEETFERMARLVEPGRRQAAVLFADLEESGTLSRRLPTAAYFELICAVTTGVDRVVARHKGIVGKHAGDGVTAFFLVHDLGSASGSARAALETARDIHQVARDAAKEVDGGQGLIDPDECKVRVGLHWGGSLYMGQLTTGGRLEVTALGDEVNECARIQETAAGGRTLASKGLLERLAEDDAEAIGIDPDRVVYRTIAELAEAPTKAVRDAGGIPVAQL